MKKLLAVIRSIVLYGSVTVLPIATVVSCGKDEDIKNIVVDEVIDETNGDKDKEETIPEPEPSFVLSEIDLPNEIKEIFDNGVVSSMTSEQVYKKLADNKWAPLPFMFTDFDTFTDKFGIASGSGKEELEAFGTISEFWRSKSNDKKDFVAITIAELEESYGLEQTEINGKFQIDYNVAINEYRPASTVFDFKIATSPPSPEEVFKQKIQSVYAGGKFVTQVDKDVLSANANLSSVPNELFETLGLLDPIEAIDKPDGTVSLKYTNKTYGYEEGIHGGKLEFKIDVKLVDESGKANKFIKGEYFFIQTPDYQPLP